MQSYFPCHLSLVILLVLFISGCSTPGIYHSAQGGESLASIAKVYGRSESQLARVNGIESPQPLAKGERIFIPGATSVRRTAIQSQGGKRSSSVPERKIQTPKEESSWRNSQAKIHPEKEKSLALQRSAPPKATSGQFKWPIQGEILRRFGDKLPFPCKGIEIAAVPGTPVQAAAAGRVIYSSDGISSFGNMIILRHDGDFYSVYAFNQKNFANVGNFVSQGERIALSGIPPQKRSPRLYFELRHHKEPLDPTFYLP